MKNKNASNAVVFKMQNGFLYFIWNLKSQDETYMRLTYVLKKNGHQNTRFTSQLSRTTPP